MVRLHCLAPAILLTSVIAADISSRETVYEFIDPPAPEETNDFSGNLIFVLGQTERLEPTTPFHDFFITIFQESLTIDGANFDPTIFNDQPSISCHYFNITGSNRKEVLTSTSTSTSTSSSAIKTTSSTSALQATDSPTSTSTSSSNSSPSVGLSTGAQIGIGIGAASAGLTIFFITWVVCRRLRSQRAPQGQGQNEEPREYYKFSNLQQQDQYSTHSPPSEIYSTPRAELYSNNPGRFSAKLPGQT